MKNNISVSSSNNKLIILAYSGGKSYELCRILTGAQTTVDVAINISPGDYGKSVVLNGVNRYLDNEIDLRLPEGDYFLLFLGINWMGAQHFSVSVNEKSYQLPASAEANSGLAWYPDLINITV